MTLPLLGAGVSILVPPARQDSGTEAGGEQHSGTLSRGNGLVLNDLQKARVVQA